MLVLKSLLTQPTFFCDPKTMAPQVLPKTSSIVSRLLVEKASSKTRQASIEAWKLAIDYYLESL